MFFLKKASSFLNNSHAEKDRVRKDQNIRCFILQFIFIALFSILIHRLFVLQIVNGQKYAEDVELQITRTIREHNTRGNIYDCNGEILAYNELVYTVTMIDDGTYASERERQLSINSVIYCVMKKLNENNEQINNELKIEVGTDGNYVYTVSGRALARFKADIFGESDPDDMTPEQVNMSANDMIQFLAGNSKFALYGTGKSFYSEEELQKYGLPKEYTDEEVLTIVGIRYMLSLNEYKKYVPITLARNVSDKTVAYIMENNQSLIGIDIGQDWERTYTGGEAFSHILGYVGKISSEEMEKYADSDRDYTPDSIVGKSGIEQYMESELQGLNGEKQIVVNNVGKVVGEKNIIKETVSGKDVYLSIDKDLQIAVYHILEQNLAGIISSNLINTKKFDKNHISDTSDIRIPIYDVYIALVNNSIIQLSDLYCADATELERHIAKVLEEKKGEVLNSLKEELLNGNTDYSRLSEEMQEYISYITGKIEILNESSIDKEDDVYKRWKDKSGISVKEFLTYAIENGWIAAGFIDSEQGYFTTDEMFVLLIENIEKKIADDNEFEKILFKWLLFEDRIKGSDICRLLYDQQILSVADDDYEKLVSGQIDAFSFMKKKIEQLEITPAQLALDPCSASAVVVQQETGKILALVSYPGYDNNRLANQMDSAYYNRLLNDKALPLYNRATQQLTAPGSTFKPITVIAGLQERVISPDSSVLCDGVFDKVFPNLKCWKHTGHGNVINAPTALQYSCNDYLCDIAYRLGTINGMEYTDNAALESLQEYSKLFYLDKKSGVEIAESQPHVTDAYGIPSAIGQGTHNYATVQLVRYVNTIASRGNVFQLSLVKGIADTNGNFVENNAVLENKVELPDSVWDTVSSGMVQFAQNNSVLRDMEISIAGKTGTAQESKSRPDHALFVGYAPAETPEITIAVRIANGYGSSNSTAVGKDIFNYYFGLENQEKIVTGEASQAFNTRTD
ncbi:MAG: penicillin-binding transpeptidase domain-containing protein [Lachnospiraceae bacterium]|nr:penicillin-binding transpeptidase domain-containing protein [Lachnospiraceae bacterium]